jgi:hypothetical protein
MKIHPVGARAFSSGQTEGQTDVAKLIVALRNFSNAPKNGLMIGYNAEADICVLPSLPSRSRTQLLDPLNPTSNV